MTESSAPRRLAKVAFEFNISQSTLVDFLNGEGIAIENKPTSKVPEEAYIALLKKFSPDKLVKEKSDKLKLTPLIHKEEKSAEATKVSHETHVAPKVEEAPVQHPPKLPEQPLPPVAEVVVPEPKKSKKTTAEPVSEEATALKKEEKGQQFKVIGKIDLRSPAKKKKDKAAEEEKTEEESPAVITEQEIPVAEESKVATDVIPEPDDKPGLTIVGKIDLDKFKPKKRPLASTDDLNTIKKKRRKRKRIDGHDGAPRFEPQTTGARPRVNTPLAKGPAIGPAAKKELDDKKIQD